MVVTKEFMGVQINKEGSMVADQMLIKGKVSGMGNCWEDVKSAEYVVDASCTANVCCWMFLFRMSVLVDVY